MLSIVWLGIALLFLFLEALTTGLNFIWFSTGALASMIVSFITDSLVLQISVFVIVTALSLIAFRPIVKKRFNSKVTPTNFDRIIGRTAVVTEEIDNSKNAGQISVLGQIWSASSAEDMVVPKDTKVEIVEIKGVRAVVRSVK